jgi:flagellar hook-associated protein 1
LVEKRRMTTALMNIGVRALAANYAALQTTGHNIANANVQGYSRQSVELATTQGQFTGAGFFGRGVDVRSVSRSHNEFLTRQTSAAQATAAADSQRLTQLQRLETLFPTGEAGLGAAAGAFLNSFVDLASHPADAAARQVVLSRAQDFAARVQQTGAGLGDLQRGVQDELGAAVAQVNDLAQRIAQVNHRITGLRGLGQPPNDLMDERDRLIGQLSEHLAVTRIDADNGSTTVFIASGQQLVLGDRAASLQLRADASDPTRSTLALQDGNAPRSLAANSLGGGGIAGLLRFQNEDLVAARNGVGQMVLGVGTAVNAAQRQGLTLKTPLGSVYGVDLFQLSAPRVVAHAANAQPAASLAVSVVDAQAVQASDYELRADPSIPGQFSLTRLADGLVRTVSNGDVVDGLRISTGTPAPQAGDRFLLQPVGRTALDFAALLSDPNEVAAASPLLSQAGASNTGTVRAHAVWATTLPLPTPGGTAQIQFTDNSGAYSWTLRDSSNSLVSTGTGQWQAGAPLPAPPADINGFSLILDGAPRLGDTLTVAPTPASAVAASNGNALALLALRDAALVGGQTATDAYARLLSGLGVRVQGGQAAAELSAAAAAQTALAQSAASGVNLDEEAARLIQFQQSYQAAAKILQVAQSVFDALLQATSR